MEAGIAAPAAAALSSAECMLTFRCFCASRRCAGNTSRTRSVRKETGRNLRHEVFLLRGICGCSIGPKRADAWNAIFKSGATIFQGRPIVPFALRPSLFGGLAQITLETVEPVTFRELLLNPCVYLTGGSELRRRHRE